jgi:hypothetical protein
MLRPIRLYPRPCFLHSWRERSWLWRSPGQFLNADPWPENSRIHQGNAFGSSTGKEDETSQTHFDRRRPRSRDEALFWFGRGGVRRFSNDGFGRENRPRGQECQFPEAEAFFWELTFVSHSHSAAQGGGGVCCSNSGKMMCQRVCTAGGKKNVGKISPAGPAWVDDSTVTGCK